MVDSVVATVEINFALSRDGGDLISHDEGSSCAYCVDFMLQPEFLADAYMVNTQNGGTSF